MDKSTGKPLLINNKTITSEATFTPDAADGSVVVKFTFDATGLGNKELVVFEKLMDADGKVLAEHEDINDKDQTVTLIKPVDTPRTGDSSRTTSVALLCFLSAAVLAWFVFEGMKKKSI
jgi:hypothetical protein